MFSRILKKFHTQFFSEKSPALQTGPEYEYCPRCDANLTLQKGYDNSLPYWICRGCGEMLINPTVDAEDDIVWICDGCGTMLNLQTGFADNTGSWVCRECGFENKIVQSELYASEEEYQEEMRNPYRGLSDQEVLELSLFKDLKHLAGRSDILLIQDRESGIYYVKKLLTTYDRSIYEFLKDHPIPHMPRIHAVYESQTCLIVLEDYIGGASLEDLLEEGSFSQKETIRITLELCRILDRLHSLPVPIVHRDIKPSNIIMGPEGDIFLLDMNAAKWYHPERAEDTHFLGTRNYAAPEQAGYGLRASSARSDIYAVGILMNVMLTGKFPKEKRPERKMWNIIARCTSLEADFRYSTRELISALEQAAGEENEQETHR